MWNQISVIYLNSSWKILEIDSILAFWRQSYHVVSHSAGPYKITSFVDVKIMQAKLLIWNLIYKKWNKKGIGYQKI